MNRIAVFMLTLLLLCNFSVTAFADDAESETISTLNDEISSSINGKKIIDVANIQQYPELPTGCESVSLTILLNYWGYPADKIDIARNYLPKLDFYWVDGEMYGADFKTTFAGDPESEYAYGCYAPCIISAADKYLEKHEYDATATDLTGTHFDDLLTTYIDNNIPVIIWITSSDLHEPMYTDTWKTPDGYTVQWLAYEHSVVLTGYDMENELIYVSDPLVGNISYDYERIKQRYIDLGEQAVLIKSNSDNTDTESKASDTDNTDTEPKVSDTDNTDTEPKVSDTDNTDIEPKVSDTDNTDTEPKVSDMDNTDTETKVSDMDNTDTETKVSDTDNTDTDKKISGGIIGDTNGDGKVSAKDSMLIQRYVILLVKLDENQFILSDVNNDGKVTNKDSLSILRYTISLVDNDNIGKEIGKEIREYVIGDWTYVNDNSFMNMSFKDDGVVLIQTTGIARTMIGLWNVKDDSVTVTLYGEDEVYIYRNNTLVKSIDNNVVFVRGTTSRDYDPKKDTEQNETPTEPNRIKQIEVENILQQPDLPTGSESVSLTMVLNYLGYPADKFEIVRNYLPKQDFYYVGNELYGADFYTTFAGDPEDENSYGCYAPCIVITANNYFADKGYNGKAYDLTSTDFETLLSDYIDKDIPLIIWITNYGLKESSLSTVWKTPDGQTLQWRMPEHTAVLTGYDREKNLVYVSDPLYGNTEYDYDTLVQRFNEMGKQSVYIDNK